MVLIAGCGSLAAGSPILRFPAMHRNAPSGAHFRRLTCMCMWVISEKPVGQGCRGAKTSTGQPQNVKGYVSQACLQRCRCSCSFDTTDGGNTVPGATLQCMYGVNVMNQTFGSRLLISLCKWKVLAAVQLCVHTPLKACKTVVCNTTSSIKVIGLSGK